MVTLFILAFASGQMMSWPGLSLEACEAARATLLRDDYVGYQLTTPDQWDKDLKATLDAYVRQSRGPNGLMVECLHLDG
jgi:hypothetical protein